MEKCIFAVGGHLTGTEFEVDYKLECAYSESAIELKIKVSNPFYGETRVQITTPDLYLANHTKTEKEEELKTRRSLTCDIKFESEIDSNEMSMFIDDPKLNSLQIIPPHLEQLLLQAHRAVKVHLTNNSSFVLVRMCYDINNGQKKIIFLLFFF